MARTLDPAAHALRRDAFIDAAQRLIQTTGYQQMSLQDVLDEMGASKGALYHYFDSKVALLEAVVERIVDVVTATLEPMVADPDIPALRKLAGVFGGIAGWNWERRELLLEVTRALLSDENAIVREKLRERSMVRLTPLLVRVLSQGKAEGEFPVGAPEQSALVLLSLILAANETAGRLFVARQTNSISFEEVERTIGAYVEAYERVLGVPAGTWPPLDPAMLEYWFG